MNDLGAHDQSLEAAKNPKTILYTNLAIENATNGMNMYLILRTGTFNFPYHNHHKIEKKCKFHHFPSCHKKCLAQGPQGLLLPLGHNRSLYSWPKLFAPKVVMPYSWDLSWTSSFRLPKENLEGYEKLEDAVTPNIHMCIQISIWLSKYISKHLYII